MSADGARLQVATKPWYASAAEVARIFDGPIQPDSVDVRKHQIKGASWPYHLYLRKEDTGKGYFRYYYVESSGGRGVASRVQNVPEQHAQRTVYTEVEGPDGKKVTVPSPSGGAPTTHFPPEDIRMPEGVLRGHGRKLRITHADEDGVTIEDKATGTSQKLSPDAFHRLMHSLFGQQYVANVDRRGQADAKVVFAGVPKQALQSPPVDEPEDQKNNRVRRVFKHLAPKLAQVGLTEGEAKRLVASTILRRGWTMDAKAILLGAVTRMKDGRDVARYEEAVVAHAENLAKQRFEKRLKFNPHARMVVHDRDIADALEWHEKRIQVFRALHPATVSSGSVMPKDWDETKAATQQGVFIQKPQMTVGQLVQNQGGSDTGAGRVKAPTAEQLKMGEVLPAPGLPAAPRKEPQKVGEVIAPTQSGATVPAGKPRASIFVRPTAGRLVIPEQPAVPPTTASVPPTTASAAPAEHPETPQPATKPPVIAPMAVEPPTPEQPAAEASTRKTATPAAQGAEQLKTPRQGPTFSERRRQHNQKVQVALAEYLVAKKQVKQDKPQTVQRAVDAKQALQAAYTGLHSFVDAHKQNARKEGIRPPPDIEPEHFGTTDRILRGAGIDRQAMAKFASSTIAPAGTTGAGVFEAPATAGAPTATSELAAQKLPDVAEAAKPLQQVGKIKQPREILLGAGLPDAPPADQGHQREWRQFVNTHRKTAEDMESLARKAKAAGSKKIPIETLQHVAQYLKGEISHDDMYTRLDHFLEAAVPLRVDRQARIEKELREVWAVAASGKLGQVPVGGAETTGAGADSSATSTPAASVVKKPFVFPAIKAHTDIESLVNIFNKQYPDQEISVARLAQLETLQSKGYLDRVKEILDAEVQKRHPTAAQSSTKFAGEVPPTTDRPAVPEVSEAVAAPTTPNVVEHLENKAKQAVQAEKAAGPTDSEAEAPAAKAKKKGRAAKQEDTKAADPVAARRAALLADPKRLRQLAELPDAKALGIDHVLHLAAEKHENLRDDKWFDTAVYNHASQFGDEHHLGKTAKERHRALLQLFNRVIDSQAQFDVDDAEAVDGASGTEAKPPAPVALATNVERKHHQEKNPHIATALQHAETGNHQGVQDVMEQLAQQEIAHPDNTVADGHQVAKTLTEFYTAHGMEPRDAINQARSKLEPHTNDSQVDKWFDAAAQDPDTHVQSPGSAKPEENTDRVDHPEKTSRISAARQWLSRISHRVKTAVAAGLAALALHAGMGAHEAQADPLTLQGPVVHIEDKRPQPGGGKTATDFDLVQMPFPGRQGAGVPGGQLPQVLQTAATKSPTVKLPAAATAESALATEDSQGEVAKDADFEPADVPFGGEPAEPGKQAGMLGGLLAGFAEWRRRRRINHAKVRQDIMTLTADAYGGKHDLHDALQTYAKDNGLTEEEAHAVAKEHIDRSMEPWSRFSKKPAPFRTASDDLDDRLAAERKDVAESTQPGPTATKPSTGTPTSATKPKTAAPPTPERIKEIQADLQNRVAGKLKERVQQLRATGSAEDARVADQVEAQWQATQDMVRKLQSKAETAQAAHAAAVPSGSKVSKHREHTEDEAIDEASEYFDNDLASKRMPGVFSDVVDFHEQLKDAPVRVLKPYEIHAMENTDAGDVADWAKTVSGRKELASQLAKSYGKDIDSVYQALENGDELPHPVVIRDKTGALFLLGGNTRLMAAAAAGMDMPVKVIQAHVPFVYPRKGAGVVPEEPKVKAPPKPKTPRVQRTPAERLVALEEKRKERAKKDEAAQAKFEARHAERIDKLKGKENDAVKVEADVHAAAKEIEKQQKAAAAAKARIAEYEGLLEQRDKQEVAFGSDLTKWPDEAIADRLKQLQAVSKHPEHQNAEDADDNEQMWQATKQEKLRRKQTPAKPTAPATTATAASAPAKPAAPAKPVVPTAAPGQSAVSDGGLTPEQHQANLDAMQNQQPLPHPHPDDELRREAVPSARRAEQKVRDTAEARLREHENVFSLADHEIAQIVRDAGAQVGEEDRDVHRAVLQSILEDIDKRSTAADARSTAKKQAGFSEAYEEVRRVLAPKVQIGGVTQGDVVDAIHDAQKAVGIDDRRVWSQVRERVEKEHVPTFDLRTREGAKGAFTAGMARWGREDGEIETRPPTRWSPAHIQEARTLLRALRKEDGKLDPEHAQLERSLEQVLRWRRRGSPDRGLEHAGEEAPSFRPVELARTGRPHLDQPAPPRKQDVSGVSFAPHMDSAHDAVAFLADTYPVVQQLIAHGHLRYVGKERHSGIPNADPFTGDIRVPHGAVASGTMLHEIAHTVERNLHPARRQALHWAGKGRAGASDYARQDSSEAFAEAFVEMVAGDAEGFRKHAPEQAADVQAIIDHWMARPSPEKKVEAQEQAEDAVLSDDNGSAKAALADTPATGSLPAAPFVHATTPVRGAAKPNAPRVAATTPVRGAGGQPWGGGPSAAPATPATGRLDPVPAKLDTPDDWEQHARRTVDNIRRLAMEGGHSESLGQARRLRLNDAHEQANERIRAAHQKGKYAEILHQAQQYVDTVNKNPDHAKWFGAEGVEHQRQLRALVSDAAQIKNEGYRLRDAGGEQGDGPVRPAHQISTAEEIQQLGVPAGQGYAALLARYEERRRQQQGEEDAELGV